MKEIKPYLNSKEATLALDNGGRFYNILTKAEDGLISKSELGKVASLSRGLSLKLNTQTNSIMITNQHIEAIKEKKRLILSTKQKAKHYLIAIIPLVIACLLIFDNLQYNYYFGFGVWIFLFLSLLFAIIQRRRLRFRKYKGNFAHADLSEALRRAAVELGWQIENRQEDYFQAFGSDPLGGIGGDVITIILGDNFFLINTVSDPRKWPFSLMSLSRKENKQVFAKHLNDVLNQRPENKDYLIPEKEWTTKRIITRLIMYPLWLLVIGVSIKMILDPLSGRSTSSGIAGMTFGIGYIYIDVKSILNRKKYERSIKDVHSNKSQ